MTRREQIEKAAIQSRFTYTSRDRDMFAEGAWWADYTMLEKACKWLEDYIDNYLAIESGNEELPSAVIDRSLINDFKNAMQQ